MFGGYTDARQVDDLWAFSLSHVYDSAEQSVLGEQGFQRGAPLFAGSGSEDDVNSRLGRGIGTQMRAICSCALTHVHWFCTAVEMGDEPPGGQEAEAQWRKHCAWRLRSDSTAETTWQDGCMAPGRAICTPTDVLLRAWCTREYQVRTVVAMLSVVLTPAALSQSATSRASSGVTGGLTVFRSLYN